MATENLALEADHGATGLCGAAQRPDQLRRWQAAGGVGGRYGYGSTPIPINSIF